MRVVGNHLVYDRHLVRLDINLHLTQRHQVVVEMLDSIPPGHLLQPVFLHWTDVANLEPFYWVGDGQWSQILFSHIGHHRTARLRVDAASPNRHCSPPLGSALRHPLRLTSGKQVCQ